ncbi:MAG TPA: sugar phosphate nucleotidyltransferase [Tepidisphaeraceae bacterium]|nr:sugar phosphate nucleotidyltransferase [Tepidisphaeraceae bacterium]
MKVIIPTAGEGKRLRPFTHTLPKVLLQVADKPILGHILEKLLQENLTDVTFVIGYMGDKIVEYVRRQYPSLNARFIVQEEVHSTPDALYGLGYAIYLTHVHHEDSNEPLLIILGDTVIEADFSGIHGASDSMIGVHEVSDPQRFGIIELDGNDYISAMVEKPEHPKTNLAICGIYYLTQPKMLYQALRENIEAGVRTKGEIQLTDALQKILERGVRMRSFKVEGWYDCGKPETLLTTNQALLRKYFMHNIEDLQKRFPSVLVKPPVYIDPAAKIAHCIVGPDTAIGAGAQVSSSIVASTIINEGAQVHNALLSGSIIGNEAHVTGTALRLYVGDKSEIKFE